MYSKEGRIRILNVLAAGGLFVLLYTDSAEPDEDTEWSELTEAAFPGYAPTSPSFDTPLINGDGDAEMNFSAPLVFTQSAPDDPETIYGAVLAHWDGLTYAIVSVLHFPSPVTVSEADHVVTVDNFRVRQGPLATS